MPITPLRLDVAQLESLVNALADQFADRVAARLRDVNAVPATSPAKHDGPRLLGMKELRSRVSISSATIYRLIKDGKFPPPKRLGSRSAWLESEVDAWITSTIE
ncbi:MAG TPA: AlpA family transcriptional regulator [Stenotrophomonas sp.]|nr:AlpA family transcriptional regulator [Stenotrophomonas sp.]